MLRLEVLQVEQKTSKKGNTFWRCKCSDGHYYNSMKHITTGVYDVEIDKDFLKSFASVGDLPKHEPEREKIPQTVTNADKSRAFSVSYAKDLVVALINNDTTAQQIMDKWTIFTAHAIWLLSQPEENIVAAAQAIEETPKEETEVEPF